MGLSSLAVHPSSVKYVIISPEGSPFSSSCLYSPPSSVNVCVFVFSALKSRSHTHTHQFINRHLWFSVELRALLKGVFFSKNSCAIKKSHNHVCLIPLSPTTIKIHIYFPSHIQQQRAVIVKTDKTDFKPWHCGKPHWTMFSHIKSISISDPDPDWKSTTAIGWMAVKIWTDIYFCTDDGSRGFCWSCEFLCCAGKK